MVRHRYISNQMLHIVTKNRYFDLTGLEVIGLGEGL